MIMQGCWCVTGGPSSSLRMRTASLTGVNRRQRESRGGFRLVLKPSATGYVHNKTKSCAIHLRISVLIWSG